MKFYLNKDTGTIITNLSGEVKGSNYIELKANSVDASMEKHVPVFEIVNDKINVTIGSALHPMEEKHYIMWIALVADNSFNIVYLKPNDKPEVTFTYQENAIIYAYCNLHGLWMNKIK